MCRVVFVDRASAKAKAPGALTEHSCKSSTRTVVLLATAAARALVPASPMSTPTNECTAAKPPSCAAWPMGQLCPDTLDSAQPSWTTCTSRPVPSHHSTSQHVTARHSTSQHVTSYKRTTSWEEGNRSCACDLGFSPKRDTVFAPSIAAAIFAAQYKSV